MAHILLTLIGKPNCHLCDEAKEVVTTVMTEFPEGTISLEEKSIQEHQDLFDAYWEKIPVLQINGKVHNYWHIDPMRLRTKLKELI